MSNLQFALSVEPENTAVSDKLAWSRRILAAGGYTVPSTASFVVVWLCVLAVVHVGVDGYLGVVGA